MRLKPVNVLFSESGFSLKTNNNIFKKIHKTFVTPPTNQPSQRKTETENENKKTKREGEQKKRRNSARGRHPTLSDVQKRAYNQRSRCWIGKLPIDYKKCLESALK